MLKLVFSFTAIVTLLFRASMGFTQTMPNQAEFTSDRMECYSPALDYKCTYGHRPGTDEGISVVERPSLNFSITYHYQGKELVGIFVTREGRAHRINRKNEEDLLNFHESIKTYFPDDLQQKFHPVLQECRKK